MLCQQFALAVHHIALYIMLTNVGRLRTAGEKTQGISLLNKGLYCTSKRTDYSLGILAKAVSHNHFTQMVLKVLPFARG